MPYMATRQINNQSPGVKKFTIFVIPSLVIITIHLVCLNHVSELI